MKVSELLENAIKQKLTERRVVVWYDSEGVFADFVSHLDLPSCNIVSATGSTLMARRQAESIFEQIDRPSASYTDKRASLLIYIPHARYIGEKRMQDPFEAFTVAGT